MKEAMFYKKIKDKKVQCKICPRLCIITEGESGFCKARKNFDGKLFSTVYAAPCALHSDPVEKKPLFHFLPGSRAYSLGTAGCNLKCKFCQNWEISQALPENLDYVNASPEKVIEDAINAGCSSVAYTYTEPAVFFEYVMDIAKLAKKKGLKNIAVTNGFINPEPLKELYKYIDAANVDYKGSDKFYREYTGAWLEPILNSMKLIKKMGIWLEITNLLISGLNDNHKDIQEMCSWIFNSLGKDVPLHFSAFHPDYIMQDIPSTSKQALENAAKLAKKLKYVYLGNVGRSDTFCPKCHTLLIKRHNFSALENKITSGRCYNCKSKIPGVFV